MKRGKEGDKNKTGAHKREEEGLQISLRREELKKVTNVSSKEQLQESRVLNSKREPRY